MTGNLRNLDLINSSATSAASGSPSLVTPQSSSGKSSNKTKRPVATDFDEVGRNQLVQLYEDSEMQDAINMLEGKLNVNDSLFKGNIELRGNLNVLSRVSSEIEKTT